MHNQLFGSSAFAWAATTVFSLASPPVSADEPSEPPPELRYHGDTIFPPDGDLGGRGRPTEIKTGIIYLNFEGADLTATETLEDEDSRTNVSYIASAYDMLVGAYPPFGNGPLRDATIQAVLNDWSEYDVQFATERPSSGDYTMVMVGPSSLGPGNNGVGGVAVLDCDDGNPNNIVFAFHAVDSMYDGSFIAGTISQEIAHSYGLEHVNGNDIMNPVGQNNDPPFRDTCFNRTSTSPSLCPDQHVAQCGTEDQQNGHRELLAIFGASTPDTEAPTVAITYPPDGATFDEGATFSITAEASDDRGIALLELYIGGALQQSDTTVPFEWMTTNLPGGDYSIYVVAEDLAGNRTTSATVEFHVGPGGGASGGTSGSDSGESSSDGSGPDASDGSNGSDDDAGPGESDSDDSAGAAPGGDDAQACACRSRAPGPGGLAMLAPLALVRFRRRARPAREGPRVTDRHIGVCAQLDCEAPTGDQWG